MNRVAKGGGGVALGALALLVMSGISAAAEPETAGVDEAIQAIDAIAGELRTGAVEVTDVDATVVAGGSVVEFSEDAADGVSMAGANGTDIEIGLPFAQAADAGELVDGSLVYDNNNGSSTTPLVHDDGSVQVLTTISDASAPTSYEYDLGIAPGARLVLNADGGVEVVEPDGAVAASVASPWALDARGVAVPTWFELAGTVLIQHVAHLGAAYPVVADPWWGMDIKWSNNDVAKVKLAMNIAAGVATIATMICNGTVAGAIPCSIAYGVAAVVFAMGSAGLDYCSRNGRGTVIRWYWVSGFGGCSAR